MADACYRSDKLRLVEIAPLMSCPASADRKARRGLVFQLLLAEQNICSSSDMDDQTPRMKNYPLINRNRLAEQKFFRFLCADLD